jgi:O-antigen/teichoic acid export membrane protein
MQTPTAESSTGKKIVGNSMWYGLEIAIENIVGFLTSVAVARALGPEKLGYVVFFNLIVGFASSIGGGGLASATRKYMSEYLGKGEPGIARAVYSATLRTQTAIGIAFVVIGSILADRFCAPDHRLFACLMIASAAPGLIAWIPAAANATWEDLSRNVPASLAFAAVNAAIIVLTLIFHWELNGIASALLLARMTELIVRIIPVQRRIQSMPSAPVPAELRKRMGRFIAQGIALIVVSIIVTDRSEVFFLKQFSALRQLAYYSVAFSIADRLLLFSRVLGAGAGLSLLLESSRDPAVVRPIFQRVTHYLTFFVMPVHIGMAVLSAPAVLFIYGESYAPAIPAVTISVLLMMPRAYQFLPQTLFQATDRQAFLVKWTVYSAVVNVALDLALIPHGGATGAAIANGLAQMFAVSGIWMKSVKENHIRIPLKTPMIITLSAIVMALVVGLVTDRLPNGLALAIGFGVGLLSYCICLRVMRVVSREDLARFTELTTNLPESARARINWALRLLASAE